MPIWDVVIAGGGPAGAATALHLARVGVRALVLDRTRFPRDKPCSEYLNPAAVAALTRLGPEVGAGVAAAAPARVAGFRLFAPSGVAATLAFTAPRPDAPVPHGLALPRRTLDAIVLAAAARAGATVREGVAVTDVRDGGDVVTVIARGERGARDAIVTRAVVGADGLGSLVARRVGRRFITPPYRVAFTAHLSDVAGVADWGELHVGRGGYVGLGPVGGGVTTVALVLPLAAVRGRGRATRDAFRDALDRFPGLRGRFASSTMVRPVLATGPFARWTTRAAGDRALLVGDAADFFDPFTGQGLFAALRGAELAAAALLDALARGDLSARALAAYRRARRAAFGGKWVLERVIALGVGWPALAERVIGRLGRRPAAASRLVGACGNVLPARAALAPRALADLLA
jgi:flavin-dependent dehydrogenase